MGSTVTYRPPDKMILFEVHFADGSRVQSDLVIEDPTVSRRHALVVLRDGTATLLDDNSLNGTWCNGERVTDGVELHDGDVIALGAATLRYVA